MCCTGGSIDQYQPPVGLLTARKRQLAPSTDCTDRHIMMVALERHVWILSHVQCGV